MSDLPRVPAFRYYFPPDEIDTVTTEVRTVLDSGGFLTMGPHGDRFEEEFAALTGTGHAVAVSSGTAALEAVLCALGVTGREVLVPDNTFAATAFAVIRAAGRPVLVDASPDLSIDPAAAADAIGPHTAAVITVHVGGLISDTVPTLADICRERGVPLIEDAAHAHGSTLAGRAPGRFGVAATYSFFSTKLMTTGEGGIVVTDDPALADSVRLLRDHAKVAGRNYHELVGNNWRMTEVQAILGRSQLRTLTESIRLRAEIASRYNAGMAPLVERGRLTLLPVPDGERFNWYKYVLFLPEDIDRDQVAADLRRHGVTASGYVYDVPLHRQPALAPYSTGKFPCAERIAATHLCLPIYPGLTPAQTDQVISAVQEALA